MPRKTKSIRRKRTSRKKFNKRVYKRRTYKKRTYKKRTYKNKLSKLRKKQYGGEGILTNKDINQESHGVKPIATDVQELLKQIKENPILIVPQSTGRFIGPDRPNIVFNDEYDVLIVTGVKTPDSSITPTLECTRYSYNPPSATQRLGILKEMPDEQYEYKMMDTEFWKLKPESLRAEKKNKVASAVKGLLNLQASLSYYPYKLYEQTMTEKAVGGAPKTATVQDSTTAKALRREREIERINDVKDGNHYEILGVNRDSTKREIKRKWLEVVRMVSPDKNFGGEDFVDSNSALVKVNNSWEVLRDEQKRHAYDAEATGSRFEAVRHEKGNPVVGVYGQRGADSEVIGSMGKSPPTPPEKQDYFFVFALENYAKIAKAVPKPDQIL